MMDSDLFDPQHQPIPAGAPAGSTRPILLDVRSSKVLILIVVATAVFTDTFFYTLIIPILPDILERRTHIPPQRTQQWISLMLSIYALTNLIVSPIAGFIMDRNRSRKPVLLGGLVLMAISTTLFAFGRVPALLLVARALQGASAAIIRVGGLALITDTFEAGKSGSALGWQSVGMFLGTFIGPLASGLLYDNFGISGVFGVAYVVLAIDVFFRLFMIERKEAARWQDNESEPEADEETPILSRSEESQLESGLLTEPETSEDRHLTQENSTSFPILKLLRDQRLLTVLWATFSCAVIMTALESVVPLYTMRLFSWTPTQTGLLIVGLSVSIVVDPLLGSLTDKYGSRWLSVVGFAVVAIVYGLASNIVHDTKKDKILLSVLLVVLGFAIGAISTPNMVEISLLTAAAEKKGRLGGFRADQVMGQAYGALSVSYQLGSLVGPAWGGAVLATQGWSVMSLTFTALGSISAVIMLCFAGE